MDVSATAGDIVLGVYADNAVHDELTSVTGGAAYANLAVDDVQGVGTDMPSALGVFSANIAPGQTGGRLLVYSAMALYNDGAIVVLALRP